MRIRYGRATVIDTVFIADKVTALKEREGKAMKIVLSQETFLHKAS